MSNLSCYRVTLPTSDPSILPRQQCRHGDGYIDVEHGQLYVIASDAKAVAEAFPFALSIERVGVGYARKE